MSQQERLFEAIGGADPVLIARSEQRRRSRWAAYGLAAACLTLALLAGYVRLLRTEPSIAPADDPPPPAVETPGSPEPHAPELSENPFLLPEEGNRIGTLRLLSYAPQSQENSVDFLIYVNEEQFTICETDSLYSIRNRDPLPEGFPVCGLDIAHQSGTSPEKAMEEAQKTFPLLYSSGSEHPNVNCLPESLYYRSGAGTDWDSEQAELWFVDDGQGGTFILTSRYFLEAEEGLGQSFRDMVSSFRVISLNEVTPSWMRELYETADRLFPALFADDLSDVSGLLAENAEADAYGEDVWESITVASVDYALDSGQEPTHATVSVKHRLNRTEGDSFCYLTMELSRESGSWRLTWSGIEK